MNHHQKLFIHNRAGQKIVVLIDFAENPKGLAFIAHGLGGYKEEKHIELFARVCTSQGLTAVRFDATNTLGSRESEGNYEDATVTNYYADLEDVIAWAKTQPWYQEPFVLIGHSLGGMSTALYAQAHPHEVRALAPIATVMSGVLSVQAPRNKDILEQWQRTGWREEESVSQPGIIKRLKWSHMEDRLRYDLLLHASALIMPVLMIVGEKDAGTPPEHQKMLFEAIPHDKKEFHIIGGAPHVFRETVHLGEIENIISDWLHTI